MKYEFKKATLMTLAMLASTQVLAIEVNESHLCYSPYHLQQKLDLSIKFGDSIENKKSIVDMDLHVREIQLSKNLYLKYKKLSGPENDLRAYLFLIIPKNSKINGVETDMKLRYQQPFIVIADSDSGKLLDLTSTVDDEQILKEYQSFYDLFQYSLNTGEYQYRNSNGWYQAKIKVDENTIKNTLIKQNLGYIENSNNRTNIQLEKSYLKISLDASGWECFYKKSMGEEVFKSELSAQSFVAGTSSVIVEADSNRALPDTHYFYKLTDDFSKWPKVKKTQEITRKAALEKLPFFIKTLSAVIQDDNLFVSLMVKEKELWQYLHEYILGHGLSNDLSKQLFWALNAIDNPASVNSLAKLTTSELSARDHFRAVSALGSTTAAFDQDSVDLLISYFPGVSTAEYSQPLNLIFVRMMGAMASLRSVTDPVHSAKIKQFLYSQAGSFDNNVNVAVIDAIGNLKGAIDTEGERILFDSLNSGTDEVKLSAASAFERIPYNAENSTTLMKQLDAANSLEIKSVLLDVLGKSENSNDIIKNKLISMLDDPSLKQQALKNIKKIDYEFLAPDIQILESKLRSEDNAVNQRYLASLILKHRREQGR
ncbi:MAG: hypothetical protein L3K25_17135 [Gammaproteobacteria bacterium]|nr:hypothetical protein [Gammaproteobacteria bacterium]